MDMDTCTGPLTNFEEHFVTRETIEKAHKVMDEAYEMSIEAVGELDANLKKLEGIKEECKRWERRVEAIQKKLNPLQAEYVLLKDKVYRAKKQLEAGHWAQEHTRVVEVEAPVTGRHRTVAVGKTSNSMVNTNNITVSGGTSNIVVTKNTTEGDTRGSSGKMKEKLKSTVLKVDKKKSVHERLSDKSTRKRREKKNQSPEAEEEGAEELGGYEEVLAEC